MPSEIPPLDSDTPLVERLRALRLCRLRLEVFEDLEPTDESDKAVDAVGLTISLSSTADRIGDNTGAALPADASGTGDALSTFRRFVARSVVDLVFPRYLATVLESCSAINDM